jgi:2-hydroxymuconate-semialdehyde hydrolase
MSAEGRRVDAGGIHTNYLEAGHGRPVVMLHGSGPGVSAFANWRLTIPTLAESFRVVAPDLVGFGFSDRPAGIDYTMTTWVSQMEGFVDALGLDSFAVVGNSFGGALALRLATLHPERVDGLVLMGSVGVPFPLTDGLDNVWGYEPSVAAMRKVLDCFAFDRSLVDDELVEVRYRASIEPGFQESYASMFPAPRQRWIDALVTDDDAIRAIGCPTLIVHGREDAVIPVSTSMRLFELIPDARLHLFGGCGHWTQIEKAAEFNVLVADFLGR